MYTQKLHGFLVQLVLERGHKKAKPDGLGFFGQR